MIESASDRGETILGIHIPRSGCENCRDRGEDLFRKADVGAYTNVFLQDRPGDRFLSHLVEVSDGSIHSRA